MVYVTLLNISSTFSPDKAEHSMNKHSINENIDMLPFSSANFAPSVISTTLWLSVAARSFLLPTIMKVASYLENCLASLSHYCTC